MRSQDGALGDMAPSRTEHMLAREAKKLKKPRGGMISGEFAFFARWDVDRKVTPFRNFKEGRAK